MLRTSFNICVIILFKLRHWALDISDVIFLIIHCPRVFGLRSFEFWLVTADVRRHARLLYLDIISGLASRYCHKV